MSAQQQHRTEQRKEWEVWVEVCSPHFACSGPNLVFPHMPVGRVFARPSVLEIDSILNEALSRVPSGLDPGDDDDGSPIIAYEALLHVMVRDPDGYLQGVAPALGLRWRKVIGWEMLPAYEQRQRMGKGVVEQRRNPRTDARYFLNMWVWRPAE